MNKPTKREMFEAIKAVPEVSENEVFVNFLNHEIELLDKKSANKKPNKNQEANEGIKAVILEVLTAEPVTVSDIIKADDRLAEYSLPKVTALLTLLRKEGRVVRTEDKKKAFYALAE